MKICSRCKEEKPHSAFHKYSTQKDGLHYYCKICRQDIEDTPSRREYAKKYRAMRLSADSQYSQHSKRKARYGIEPDEYIRLWHEQNGKCAICDEQEKALYKGKIRSLAVDHCHKTGKVRALLCNACNNGLGRFRDDPSRLEAAIRYLQRFSAD
jgi:hypothetical protein